MYKNQLQELAQRSCFNLPSYTCIREGPDHAPRFKAAVNFNGDSFESPSYCCTLRQAEHSAAEVALNALSCRGPSNSLAARILDETGVYKNLLQEVSQRVGASLPIYTTFRTGLGHLPVFTCIVELAKVIFSGEPAKNKKQAEKNAAMTAWLSLKSLVQQSESSMFQKPHKDEPEHVTVAHALQKYLIKAGFERKCFPIKFPALNPRPSSMQQSPATTSKILPFICPKIASGDKPFTAASNSALFQKIYKTTQTQPVTTVANESLSSLIGNQMPPSNKFHVAGAAPYIPVQRCIPHQRIAPPVTIRNAIPVFSAPPIPSAQSSMGARPSILRMAPPVRMRQAVAGSAASPDQMEELPNIYSAVKVESPQFSRPPPARIEQPPLSRAASGRLGDSTLFKLPLVRVEEHLGPKLLPPALQLEPLSFEVPRVQIHSAVSSSISSSTRTKPSINETRISAPDIQQGSAEIKALKELTL